MRGPSLLVVLAIVFTTANGFGGTEEKFIKKYAMMKVYESCFGLQVLKEVRKEMKEAALKCSGFQADFDDKYINHEPTEGVKEQYTTMSTERTTRTPKPMPTKRPVHSADSILLQQWTEQEQNKLDQDDDQQAEDQENDLDLEPESETNQPPTRKPLDLSKLEEAIMNINRPGNHVGIGQQRPGFPGMAGMPGAPPNFQAPPGGFYPPMYYPPPMPYPAYPPYNPYYPYYQSPAAPAGHGASAGYNPYYNSRSGYRSAKITKGFDAAKSTETDAKIGEIAGTSRQKKLLAVNETTPSVRSSRRIDLRKVKENTATPSTIHGRTLVPPKHVDVKASMDAMTFHSGAKMRNITCVMQELGYLDENLEPNYEKMMERINKLQVQTELKRDMVDGVKFCKQFSQCVPEVKKDKFQLSKELLRPMFFFRCYKHKKLESCIMKDVRDRFASSSTAFEDNNVMTNELRRSLQHKKTDLASSVFEFMYGSAADDFDALL